MSIELHEFDEIGIIGQPYHGLWKGGVIPLPNSTNKACPAPNSGAVTLLRVPGRPAVSRTTAEQAIDTTNGWQWRNYALISGGCYGLSGQIVSNSETAFGWLIDGAGVRWRTAMQRIYPAGWMELRLRRFGHIDGTSQSWSSAVNFTIPTQFWNSDWYNGSLICIAQNTTGREQVLGCVLNGNSEHATAMIKVSISGTVDLTVAGFGLTLSVDSIELPGRENHYQVTDQDVSGVFRVTQTRPLKAVLRSDTNVIGGYGERIVIDEDGVQVSDSGDPPPISGYDWVPNGETVWTYFTDKVKEVTQTDTAVKYIWASYLEDELKLWSVEYRNVSINTEAWERTATGWVANYTENHSTKLISRCASTVINEQTYPTTAAYSGSEYATPPSWAMTDGDSHTETTLLAWNLSDIIGGGIAYEVVGGINTWYSTYLTCVRRRGQNAGNPLMVLVTRRHFYDTGVDYYTFATHSIHAPSGTSQASAIDISNLYASWHPVADQIAVDSELICWF